ncbi:ROK family protein [Streptomyces sp. NRRL B-24572]|uniref:ROK family protein n=1 Tax=Streptomyces sp. NRRL B-24572 TaxID=1962156 RepID=UPI00358ED755
MSERAAAGDVRGLAAVDAFARSLAMGIGAMILAVDPQLLLIGGGFARSCSAMLEPIERRLAEFIYDVPRLAGSSLGEDAVVIGLAEAARGHVPSLLFAPGEVPALLP